MTRLYILKVKLFIERKGNLWSTSHLPDASKTNSNSRVVAVQSAKPEPLEIMSHSCWELLISIATNIAQWGLHGDTWDGLEITAESTSHILELVWSKIKCLTIFFGPFRIRKQIVMQSLFYVLFFLSDRSQKVKSLGSHFPSLFIAHLHSLELLSCSCVMFPLFYGFESLVFLLFQMITVVPLESVACRLVLWSSLSLSTVSRRQTSVLM